jgi:hypothetical protein
MEMIGDWVEELLLNMQWWCGGACCIAAPLRSAPPLKNVRCKMKDEQINQRTDSADFVFIFTFLPILAPVTLAMEISVIPVFIFKVSSVNNLLIFIRIQ